jgi:hypothetical protein
MGRRSLASSYPIWKGLELILRFAKSNLGEWRVSKLLGRLGALAHDRRGSIAIIFGLALIPMATLAGVAVDYANVSRLNARLKAAADAAALSAVRDYASYNDLSLAQKKRHGRFQLGPQEHHSTSERRH